MSKKQKVDDQVLSKLQGRDESSIIGEYLFEDYINMNDYIDDACFSKTGLYSKYPVSKVHWKMEIEWGDKEWFILSEKKYPLPNYKDVLKNYDGMECLTIYFKVTTKKTVDRKGIPTIVAMKITNDLPKSLKFLRIHIRGSETGTDIGGWMYYGMLPNLTTICFDSDHSQYRIGPLQTGDRQQKFGIEHNPIPYHQQKKPTPSLKTLLFMNCKDVMLGLLYIDSLDRVIFKGCERVGFEIRTNHPKTTIVIDCPNCIVWTSSFEEITNEAIEWKKNHDLNLYGFNSTVSGAVRYDGFTSYTDVSKLENPNKTLLGLRKIPFEADDKRDEEIRIYKQEFSEKHKQSEDKKQYSKKLTRLNGNFIKQTQRDVEKKDN